MVINTDYNCFGKYFETQIYIAVWKKNFVNSLPNCFLVVLLTEYPNER